MYQLNICLHSIVFNKINKQKSFGHDLACFGFENDIYFQISLGLFVFGFFHCVVFMYIVLKILLNYFDYETFTYFSSKLSMYWERWGLKMVPFQVKQ